jgi:C-terminal processing protease CtpA/Prc
MPFERWFAFFMEVDNIIGNMRKHKGVVLDLRGNPGGSKETLEDLLTGVFDYFRIGRRTAVVDPPTNDLGPDQTMDRLLGGMFQYDRKIGDLVERKPTKPRIATGRHHDAFTGRFALLIDSGSASASEIFARVIQLEKRGFIVGDHSAGMVMESQFYPHETAPGSEHFYGASITDADLLMTDGQSLEHVGVEPDILLLPTAQDLATGKDPVLAKAASLVGAKLTPEEAASAFPYEDPGG